MKKTAPSKKKAMQPQKPARPIDSAASKPSAAKKKKSAKKPAVSKPVDRQAADSKPAAGNKPLNNAASAKKAVKAPLRKQSVPKKGGTIGRKRGSRGGNYSLYYFFGAVVLVIVFIVLANTVLFDCTSIEVEGNLTYTSEDIAAISGIKRGDNLLKVDFEAAEQSIVSTFPYIDMADVSRISPTKVKISITEAEKWYCMRFGSKNYIISRRGKVLEQDLDNSLPMVIGYEADSPVVGAMLASKVDGKTNLPTLVLGAAEEAGLTNITSINMTDRFEIEVLVDNRITLQLGNSTNLESKMNVAKALIDTEIEATGSWTVDLTNPEKVPVRDDNIADNQNDVPIIAEPQTEEATAESTAEATE